MCERKASNKNLQNKIRSGLAVFFLRYLLAMRIIFPQFSRKQGKDRARHGMGEMERQGNFSFSNEINALRKMRNWKRKYDCRPLEEM